MVSAWMRKRTEILAEFTERQDEGVLFSQCPHIKTVYKLWNLQVFPLNFPDILAVCPLLWPLLSMLFQTAGLPHLACVLISSCSLNCLPGLWCPLSPDLHTDCQSTAVVLSLAIVPHEEHQREGLMAVPKQWYSLVQRTLCPTAVHILFTFITLCWIHQIWSWSICG